MKLLVSNVGSTSLKFKLFDMPGERVLCEAKVERVGSLDSAIYSYRNLLTGAESKDGACSIPTYADGIRMFLGDMTSRERGVLPSVSELECVGFKTVLAKGYYGVHRLEEDVLRGMRDYLFVAPVHNRAYLEAIGQFQEILPGVPLVGVFETAFHTTIPRERRLYGIPYEWYEKYGVMKMGYHGASHAYVAGQAPGYGKADRVISCHLGGSCSLCAIQDGKSVDNSFGFSLQTGIPHANRVGDADPYLVPFLLNEGMPMEEIMDGLSKNGGLLGLSGVSNDTREILQAAGAGNERARLALDVFVNGVVRYIGSYYAELGGLDQLVFTGGIGENAAELRGEICRAVRHLGLWLDEEANRSRREGILSAPDSPAKIVVIPANEELGVARQAYGCITQ